MRRLTTKQAKLVQGIAAGKSTLQAGREAGYKSPQVQSYQALDSLRVQSALNKLMTRQGLSEPQLLKPIVDGIKATKHLSGMVMSLDGTMGEVQHEVPDHLTRLKASEQGWKLRGKLMPSRVDDERTPTQVVYHLVTFVNPPLGESRGNGHALPPQMLPSLSDDAPD